MSSRVNAPALAADPSNDLFWRFDMRRLCAEEVRDSILAVNGKLSTKMYGRDVYPEIPREVLAGQSRPGYGWPKSPPEEQNRRSVYAHVKRSLIVPILESFDAPETDRSTAVRFATTQPTQALAMLNSDYLNQQAAELAQRVRHEAGGVIAAQVRRALQLALSRPPTADEARCGLELIESFRCQDHMAAEAAVKYFCLLVLNLDEFMYLD